MMTCRVGKELGSSQFSGLFGDIYLAVHLSIDVVTDLDSRGR